MLPPLISPALLTGPVNLIRRLARPSFVAYLSLGLSALGMLSGYRWSERTGFLDLPHSDLRLAASADFRTWFATLAVDGRLASLFKVANFERLPWWALPAAIASTALALVIASSRRHRDTGILAPTP